jgi:hypothetical protein
MSENWASSQRYTNQLVRLCTGFLLQRRTVSAEQPGSGSDRARLVEIADRGCIMMNTLRGKLDLRARIGLPV